MSQAAANVWLIDAAVIEPAAVLPVSRASAAALLCVGLVHLGGLAVWLAGELARVPQDVTLFAGRQPPAGGNEALFALRAMPELLRDVPADAKVLLVSSLFLQVQYEYYVLPRPYRQLQLWSEQILDLIAKHAPEGLVEARRRRERLDARGVLLTAPRLAAGLEWADYVVMAGAAVPELAAHLPRLEPRGEQLQFALYRVRR